MEPVKRPFRQIVRHSFQDSAWYSLMVGWGETYLAAFTLHIGLGDIHSGFISVVPVAIGSLIQLALASFLTIRYSHRTWVLICASGQILSLFCLFLLPFLFSLPATGVMAAVLYAVTTLYWTLGLSSSSSWNTWMGDLIPRRLHVRFFSNRSRVSQAFVLVGIISAGLALNSAKHVTLVFALIFLCSGIARIFSGYHIFRQPEAEVHRQPLVHLRSLKQTGLVALIGYSFFLQIMVNIAAPYFNPYMLKVLNLNYVTYTFLMGTTFLSRIVLFPVITRFAEKYGPYRLLTFGTLLLSSTPLFWHLYDDLRILFALQIISGIGWGLQDLGLLLTVFDRYDRKTRSRVLTLLNVYNSIGMLIGAVVGSLLLKADGLSKDAYHVVFIISCVGRLASFLILPFLYQEVRQRRWVIFTRIVGLRPMSGGILRPILHIAKDRETEYSSKNQTPK